MTRVLYLHGLSADPDGRKRWKIAAEPGFTVEAPALPFSSIDDIMRSSMNPAAGNFFTAACDIAQSAANVFQPDVIVGSSMGGAVALRIDSPAARVLIAPATTSRLGGIPGLPREWRIPSRTVILHSQNDEWVPFASSVRLLEQATRLDTPGDSAVIAAIGRRLQEEGYSTVHERLVRIGRDHRCNEPDASDASNKNPDPLLAMIHAVHIVARADIAGAHA